MIFNFFKKKSLTPLTPSQILWGAYIEVAIGSTSFGCLAINRQPSSQENIEIAKAYFSTYKPLDTQAMVWWPVDKEGKTKRLQALKNAATDASIDEAKARRNV